MNILCNHCNKSYKSYQSRCNHIRKYHKDVVVQNVQPIIQHVAENVVQNVQHVVDQNILECKYCNKKLCDRVYRWRHEKKCKEKQLKNEMLLKELLEDENEHIKEENKNIKEEFKELKLIVNNLSKSKSNSKIINVNTSIINNIETVNNINSLGYENILPKFSEKEKIRLLTGIPHEEYPIIELVRKIYTNDKFKEDRNTLLTNLRSKDCLFYNSDSNKFEATNKNNHIENIIENRRHDIASMYNGFTDTDKLKLKERKVIEEYLDKLKDKKLKELYEKHKEEIIYIIYNCKEFMNNMKDNLIEV